MSCDGRPSVAEPGPGRSQQLKRKYNMSFSLTEEDQISDTDGSNKKDEDDSPGTRVQDRVHSKG